MEKKFVREQIASLAKVRNSVHKQIEDGTKESQQNLNTKDYQSLIWARDYIQRAIDSLKEIIE